MYHYLYQTTNLINGKIYIGIHSSEFENDMYYGSGIVIMCALNKNGKENFKKDILGYFDSRIKASRAERRVVNEDFVAREDTYNLQTGGTNGHTPSLETRRKMSKNHGGEKIYTKERNNKISVSLKSQYANGNLTHDGESNTMYGKQHSKTTIQKQSNKRTEWHKNNLPNCSIQLSIDGITYQSKVQIYKKLNVSRRELKKFLKGEINFMVSIDDPSRLKCIHCEYEGNSGVIARLHNDKCKFNPKL